MASSACSRRQWESERHSGWSARPFRPVSTWSVPSSRKGAASTNVSSVMALIVLDSSAVLALILSEPGAKEVESVIADSLISVVNESEVMSQLVWGGESAERAEEIVGALPYEVADLDRRQAFRAAALWKPTRARGLSLGDRCCLALA